MITEIAFIEHMNGTRTLYAKVQPIQEYELVGHQVIQTDGEPFWMKVTTHRYGDAVGDAIVAEARASADNR